MKLYTINGCNCYLKESTAKKILVEVSLVAWEQEMTQRLCEAHKVARRTGDWSHYADLWDILVGDPYYD